MNPSILLIDDDRSILMALNEYFKETYDVHLASGGREGLSKFQASLPLAVVLDLRMPDMEGMEVLEKIKESDPNIPVIMLTAYGDIETAVKAIKLGADQFLTKPVDLHALDSIIEKAVNNMKLHNNYQVMKDKLDNLNENLFLDPQTLKAVNLMAANPNTTILITGPTGTGKGVIAELIHRQSARAGALFVDINCAGLSEALLESELFGHERGAFTDAKSTKKGLMEVADGGTLFLDEIGEMPMPTQAKILKAIETKTFRRIGGTQTLSVDTRITAATNSQLLEKIKNGDFREDLYYRLHVIPIKLPPLKERREDIPDFASFFLEEFNVKLNKSIPGFTDEAISLLVGYFWPGNIRELKNVIERAVMLCESDRIGAFHLPKELRRNISGSGNINKPQLLTIEESEKRQIIDTLNHTKNNKAKAARILGIHVSTLARKIKGYGID